MNEATTIFPIHSNSPLNPEIVHLTFWQWQWAIQCPIHRCWHWPTDPLESSATDWLTAITDSNWLIPITTASRITTADWRDVLAYIFTSEYDDENRIWYLKVKISFRFIELLNWFISLCLSMILQEKLKLHQWRKTKAT